MASFLYYTTGPLGLRNNNPGNIRPLGKTNKWLGQVGKRKGFVIFSDVAYGVRAMVKNALTHITRYKHDTLRKYINAYAPPSENDTAKYIREMAKGMGIGPDDKIEITYDNLKNMVRSHLILEIGAQYSDMISDDDIARGISLINQS